MLWRRVAGALDLGRLGVRRTWTVRRQHGVHVVSVRQSPLGDTVLLDGAEVGRTDPWSYDSVVPFTLAGAPAAVRYRTDTAAGTMWTELYVDGERVAPDVRRFPVPADTRWGPLLERVAYAVAGALVAGGLAGGPIADAVRQVIWTGTLLVMFAGLRALDPFGAITVAFDKMLEDQPSMIVAGLEVAAIAALARDRRGIRRRIPFLGARRALPRVLGWLAVVLAAFIVLMLS
jgi:hypothetical protein